MSTYKIVAINWVYSTNITDLVISPKNNLNVKYAAKIAHESESKWMEFFDLMYLWSPEVPVSWYFDEPSSTIKFYNNKHGPIKVVKKPTTKK